MPWPGPTGTSVTARAVREFNWTATPLGPIEGWPPSLRTTLDLCLESVLPAFLWWGPDLIQFYNDAALAIVRARHPALGRPAREAMDDIWNEIGAMLESVVDTGIAVRGDDVPMVPDRGGARETAWFTFSYNPVRDETGAVAGVFGHGIETTTHVRAEAALRDSEERYRSLFERIDEGFCLVDVMFDAAGAAVDYRFVEVNPAFEAQSGLTNAVGRTIRDIAPHSNPRFEIYGRIVETGEPARFESRAEHLGRWYEVYAFRVGAREQRRVALLFNDVTERKKHERRQAYLLRLHDALRPLREPQDIKATAARLLGEQLGVNRAFYADAEGEYWLVTKGYERGIPLLPDEPFLMSAYGPWIIADFRAGRPLIVRDHQADARFQISERAALALLQIVGAAAVPLVKDGVLMALLVVHTVTARQWSDADLAIIAETAERTWASVEAARAEAALRTSEEHHRLFVSATSDVVYRMSADWDHVKHIDGKMFLATTDEPRTDWSDAYIPVDDRRRVMEEIGKAVAGKRPFEMEHRVFRRDGSIGWTFSRAIPLLDERGDIVEWFGAASDVTIRKRAVEALSASEARYRMLIDSIDEGFTTIEVLFDEGGQAVDYRFLQVNPSFARQTGIEGAEGRRMREIAPQHERHWFEIYGRVALTGEPMRFTREAAQLGRWYEGYAFRVEDPSLRRVGVLFNDVTDRRQAEDALRQSEERLRAVIQSIKDYAIFTLDTGGRVTGWNEGARRLTGYDAREVLGQRMTMFYTAEDAALGKPARDMDHALITGRSEDEGWRVRKNGSRFWANEIMRPLTDSAGQTVGVAKISRDLTERKVFEDALQRAHDSLEERVRERTAEVQSLFVRLVSAQEEERRRIARNVHDQLGQQVTALRFNLAALSSQAKDIPALLDQAHLTQQLAEELDHSIDFLTWELRPASLDDIGLAAALHNLTTGWSERFGVPAAFTATGEDEPRLPRDVEANLYRLVQEALHNVLKHAGASQVTVSMRRMDHEWVIVVEDDGRGFDVSQSGPRHGRLGLVSMRERAALAGGRLDIASSPGSGTSIVIHVPASRR